MTSRVAVVGAGISGLGCARTLVNAGLKVTVFDKGRTPGGRLATKRVGSFAFDTGAQYFTARSEVFRTEVEGWLVAGACALWEGRFVHLAAEGGAVSAARSARRYVGAPSMSAFAAHLAEGLQVKTSHRVDSIEATSNATDGSFLLRGTVGPLGTTLGPSGSKTQRESPESTMEDFGMFDHVAVCLPSQQAAHLLATACPELATQCRRVALAPCFAVGFVVEGDALPAVSALPFDGGLVVDDASATRENSPLSWIARNSSKPGRPSGEQWMLHATPRWSEANLPMPPDKVAAALLDEFARLAKVAPFVPTVVCTHRWMLARAVVEPTLLASTSAGALVDEQGRLGVAGDWLTDGRVEGAYLSGLALAHRLLALP